jgi:hypothetical protein
VLSSIVNVTVPLQRDDPGKPLVVKVADIPLTLVEHESVLDEKPTLPPTDEPLTTVRFDTEIVAVPPIGSVIVKDPEVNSHVAAEADGASPMSAASSTAVTVTNDAILRIACSPATNLTPCEDRASTTVPQRWP